LISYSGIPVDRRTVRLTSAAPRKVRVAAKSSFAFNGVISTRTICKPFQPLAYYVHELRRRGWKDAIIYLPHDGVATNNITGKRYIDHWTEAGF
jgi:hypothetical protein